MSDAVERALDLLDTATAALTAAEERPGQREMAERIARALEDGQHLVVQAGTGTGKSLAYLTPAIAVAATAAAQHRAGHGGPGSDVGDGGDADEEHDGFEEAESARRRRVVVVTATKALQDQLATKDLPFLARALAVPVDFAVLKGRSNYLCLQRLEEVTNADQGQLELDGISPVVRDQITRLADWANDHRDR